jgi:hypothetical protein
MGNTIVQPNVTYSYKMIRKLEGYGLCKNIIKVIELKFIESHDESKECILCGHTNHSYKHCYVSNYKTDVNCSFMYRNFTYPCKTWNYYNDKTPFYKIIYSPWVAPISIQNKEVMIVLNARIEVKTIFNTWVDQECTEPIAVEIILDDIKAQVHVNYVNLRCVIRLKSGTVICKKSGKHSDISFANMYEIDK